MKLIKNILVGLGSIFAIFILLAIYLFDQSSDFKEQNEQFVKDFTHEFSNTWDINSVSDLTTNGLLSQINTPNGKHALNIFRSLGKLVEIKDVELNNYESQASGIITAKFIFKAKYENASSLVTVTLQKKDEMVKVHGFHIEPIGNVSAPKEFGA